MSGYPYDFSNMWHGYSFDEPPRWQRRNPRDLPPAQLNPPQNHNAPLFPDMGFSNALPVRPLLQASRLPELQAPAWTFYDGNNNAFANGEMRGQPQHGNPWAMNHHGDDEASNQFVRDVQDFARLFSADARAAISSEMYGGTEMTPIWQQADARGNASQGRGFRHPPQRVVEGLPRNPPPVQVRTIATSQTEGGGNDERPPEVYRPRATRNRRESRQSGPYLSSDDFQIYQGTSSKRKRENQITTNETGVSSRKRGRCWTEPLPPARSYRRRSTLRYVEVYEENSELAQPHNPAPPGQTDDSTSSEELQPMDDTTAPNDKIKQ